MMQSAGSLGDTLNADPWQREFDGALRAVRDGALLARDIRQRIGEPAFLKADQSPVTVADFAVQALVAHRLGEMFPDDPLVAEEDATALRASAGQTVLQSVLAAVQRAALDLDSSQLLETIDHGRAVPGERFWTLDPVDGTQGFIRGDQYVVALALIVRGRVEIGLLGCPELSLNDRAKDGGGAIACAVRNRGAFCTSLAAHDFIPLRVSSCRDPHVARVLRSFEVDHIDLNAFDAIVRTLGVETPPILMDSQAKHAVIAAGRAELLIRISATKSFHDKIWDQAAGSLIIEEAGGRVTDLGGARLDFETGRLLTRNKGVVASNGLLHTAVLDAFRRVAG
jgi:3'(2'), 5'-bisphosphate nucleotidase